MEKLIKIREYVSQKLEESHIKELKYKELKQKQGIIASVAYQSAYMDIIEELDSIIVEKDNIVKI